MYKEKLTEAMTFLGKQENTIFIGQQIVYPGNPMSTTLINVGKEKMIEVPVMEETQMGMTLGLAMTGKCVISFYPRWDFLLSATNQLVNHVDKFKLITNKNVHLILRIGKGADKPLDPGHQHKGNYYKEFKSICKNINFFNLTSHKNIINCYKQAFNNKGIYLIVEYPEKYYES